MPIAVVTIGDAEFEVSAFTANPGHGNVDDTGTIQLFDCGYSGPGRQVRADISFTVAVTGRRKAGTSTADLRQWTVGFVQNVVASNRTATFTRIADGRLFTWTESAKDDPLPLFDGSDDSRPWYKSEGAKAFAAETGGDVQLATSDSPAFRVPLAYPKENSKYKLTQIEPTSTETYRIWLATRKGDETPHQLAKIEWTVQYDVPRTQGGAAQAVTGDPWNLVGKPANRVTKTCKLTAQ
jgi:hypothetical protein